MTNSPNQQVEQTQTIDKETQARVAQLDAENARLRAEIAEHKKCEKSLRRGETLYRTIAHFAYDWIYWEAANGTLQYVSPSCERITGYTPDEFMANPDLLADLIVAEDSEVWADHDHNSGIVHKQELQFRIRRRDGEIRWIEHFCQPVLDDEGAFNGFRVNNRDISRRKQAEIGLQKSEALLAEAQRIAHLGHWAWNIQTNELLWSDEIYRIFGLPRQEFGATYEAFLDSVHPDDRDYVQQSVARALNREQPYAIDHRLVRPDGSERIVHEQAEVTFDKDGQPVRRLGTVQDITRRRQVEQELEQHRNHLEDLVATRTAALTRTNAQLEQEIGERFRVEEKLKEQNFIINKSPVVVFLWRAVEGWPVEYVSDNIREFGYSPQDFYAEKILFADMVHPDDLERVRAEVAAYSRADRPDFVQEYRLLTASGGVRWVEDRTWIRRDVNRQITHYQGVVFDITPRKEAEAALQESEQTARALLDASTDTAMLLEPDGTIVATNEPFANTLEHTVSELIGQNVFDLLPDHVAESHRRRFGKVIDTKQPVRFEDMRSERWYDNHLYPILDAPGRVCRIAVYARDITESRQVELALQHANRELKQHLEELSTLNLIAQTVATITDLEKVLGVVAGTMSRLFDAYGTDISLLEGREARLTVFARIARDGIPVEGDGPVVPVADDPVAGKVMDTGQSVTIAQAQTDPLTESIWGIMQARNIQTLLSLPLLARGKTIGLITVYADQPDREFTYDEVSLAETMAGQVAGAVETARLFGQEQERRQEAERRRQIAESLADFLALLNSDQSLADTLNHIAVQANRLLHTDANVICRQEAAGSWLKVLAAQGRWADQISKLEIPLGTSALEQALATGQPLALSDMSTVLAEDMALIGKGATPSEPLAQLATQFQALLAIPLIDKEEIYGGIIFYYCEPRLFSGEEIALAVIFSNQVALAIENARLRVEAERAAVAAERSRLARDLHDSVTQTLFSVAAIAEALPRVWHHHPMEAERALTELRRLTQGALAEMRNLLLELRPAALVEKPIGELFRQLADAMMGRTRMRVTTTVVGEPPLPPDVQIALYRIAQEALNNITKHARASHIKLGLYREPAQVELHITDDGRGFDPDIIAPDQMGVAIMAERAEAIGATFAIHSQSGQGTEILVVWPDS